MIGDSPYYRLPARYPISRGVLLTLLRPVMAIICGVVVFGGSPGWTNRARGAVTLIGVAILQFRTPRRGGSFPEL